MESFVESDAEEENGSEEELIAESESEHENAEEEEDGSEGASEENDSDEPSAPSVGRKRSRKALQDSASRSSSQGESTTRRSRRTVNYCEESYEEVLKAAKRGARRRPTKAAIITRKSSRKRRSTASEEIESSEEEEEVMELEDDPEPEAESEEEGEEINSERLKLQDDEKVIERIMAHRFTPSEDESAPQIEYYVKWKDQSYLHSSWVLPSELEADRFGKSKLLRYQRKGELLYDDVDEVFNPSFLEVDRIVTHTGEPDTEEGLHFLVKWQALPYSDATWEVASDVADDEKIQQYYSHNLLPTPAKLKCPARPAASKWAKYDESPLYKGGHTLRPYQLEGLNWLTFCWYNKRNSILADEMGLGKTVQTVSVVNHLFSQVGIRGPFLIIAPLITVPHWQREFEGWTEMNTIVYHGNTEARQLMRDHEFYYDGVAKGKRSAKAATGPFKFNVLITTFEMIMTDAALLSSIPWKYVAVDEAHRLKNKSCKLINVLRTFSFDHLLLLTGTPLQNNTEELWTLLNLMDPERFESVDEFMVKFGTLTETSQVEELHTILRPYLLRRMKEDVE